MRCGLTSAATFAELRAELPEKAEFATIQLQGAAIRQQMRQLREKYSEIVIDVGGRDTGSLRAAALVSTPLARDIAIWPIWTWGLAATGRPQRQDSNHVVGRRGAHLAAFDEAGQNLFGDP